MSDSTVMTIRIALFCLCMFGTLGYAMYLDHQRCMVCIAATGNPGCKR